MVETSFNYLSNAASNALYKDGEDDDGGEEKIKSDESINSDSDDINNLDRDNNIRRKKRGKGKE